MSFEVAAEAYDRFMGRFSRLLSPQMADVAGVRAGQAALDVGCGTGMLTAVLVDRLGAANVTGIDPSESFVAAARERFPGVRIEQGSAEALPFDDDAFDVAIAQLVVHFMSDPVGGVREMRRVTRPGGVVAACVWDHAGGRTPLGPFWEAARELAPDVDDESQLPGARPGHLTELFRAAGLREVEETTIAAAVEHETFEEWWEPFLLGVGPAGAHTAGLNEEGRARLEQACRDRLANPPFVLEANAWAATGRVG
jgi:SAM-dependent methyltransferase